MELAHLFPDLISDLPDTIQIRNLVDTLCVIDYEEEYKLAISLLDKVLQMNETSRRVILLTDYIVNQCEGHYTAWSLRRRCINSMNELESEMQWITRYTADCPKNYQLWQHRMHIFKAVMQQHDGNALRVRAELEEVLEELARNPKNYHAWQYRQWVIGEFGCNDEEEEKMCRELLKEDPYNNSVYNHLYFLHNKRALPMHVLKSIVEGLPENDSLTAFKTTLLTD